eukprot:2347835-Rhodomonas_salina.1
MRFFLFDFAPCGTDIGYAAASRAVGASERGGGGRGSTSLTFGACTKTRLDAGLDTPNAKPSPVWDEGRPYSGGVCADVGCVRARSEEGVTGELGS